MKTLLCGGNESSKPARTMVKLVGGGTASRLRQSQRQEGLKVNVGVRRPDLCSRLAHPIFEGELTSPKR
jgi:hypothetical protein